MFPHMSRSFLSLVLRLPLLSSLRRCLTIVFFSTVSLACGAIEFEPRVYDVYIGDLNNDGRSDFYFHGKDNLVPIGIADSLLVFIPISLTNGFIIYRNDEGYEPPGFYKLTNSQVTSHILQGKLRKAVASDNALSASTDILYWKDALNGFTSVLIRGAAGYEPALLLATYADVDVPLIMEFFDPGNTSIPNISDRNIAFTLQDANGDGRRDLVAGGQVLLTNYNGFLHQKAYNLSYVSTSPVAEEYFYDQLGRLIGVESTDGVSQNYDLDREDNRRRSDHVKGI